MLEWVDMSLCRSCVRDNITFSSVSGWRKRTRIAFCGQRAWCRTVHFVKERLSGVIRREIGHVYFPVGGEEFVHFFFFSPADCLCVLPDRRGALPSVVLTRYKKTWFFETFRTFCFVVKQGESLYIACCVCHQGPELMHGVGGAFSTRDRAVAMVKDQFRRLPLGPFYWG